MLGFEYFLYIAILCTFAMAFVLGLEWKRAIRRYREDKKFWNISNVILMTAVISLLLFGLWVLTPIEIKTVEVDPSDVTIVNIETSKQITRYNNKNYISETTAIDTLSVGVQKDSVKYNYRFGITVFGDTVFKSLNYKELRSK